MSWRLWLGTVFEDMLSAASFLAVSTYVCLQKWLGGLDWGQGLVFDVRRFCFREVGYLSRTLFLVSPVFKISVLASSPLQLGLWLCSSCPGALHLHDTYRRVSWRASSTRWTAKPLQEELAYSAVKLIKLHSLRQVPGPDGRCLGAGVWHTRFEVTTPYFGIFQLRKI